MPHHTSRGEGFRDILSLTAKIAHERIAPTALQRDSSGTFPSEELLLLGQAGLLAPIVSQDHGGAGLSREGFASVVKEIARRCASTALVCVSHEIVAKALESAGTDAAKQRLLPKLMDGRLIGAFAVHEAGSGSNAAAISSRAELAGEHYVVDGSKIFVTSGGEADVYLVLVRTQSSGQPHGMSMLVVEKVLPAFRLVAVKSEWACAGPRPERCSSRIVRYRSRTSSVKKVRESRSSDSLSSVGAFSAPQPLRSASRRRLWTSQSGTRRNGPSQDKRSVLTKQYSS